MNSANTIRFGLDCRYGYRLAGMILCGASWLSAQTPQNVPVPKPSAAVSTLPPAQATNGSFPAEAAPATPVAPHLVQVDYADGKLAVKATNASLNEILREVSHKTGMKITGGVADDRVFGDYGPSSPAVVLDALLEGTGSNILLVEDADGKPQLTLTPRRGGATPPNPNTAQSNDSEDGTPTMYVPPTRPFQPPNPNGRTPVMESGDSETPAEAGDPTEGTAPKTPQQIYEQLQQTMQQKNNAPPTPPE